MSQQPAASSQQPAASSLDTSAASVLTNKNPAKRDTIFLNSKASALFAKTSNQQRLQQKTKMQGSKKILTTVYRFVLEDQNFSTTKQMGFLLKSQQGFIAIVALAIFMLMAVFSIMIQKTTMDTINSIKNSNNYYSARDIADSTMEYLRWDLNKRAPGYNYKPETCVYGEFAQAAGEVDPCAGKNNGIALPLDSPWMAPYANFPGSILPGVTQCEPNKVFKFIGGENGCSLVCAAEIDPNANGAQNEDVCDQILTAAGILAGDTANKDVKITMEIKGRNEKDSEKFKGSCSNTFFAGGCYTVPMPGTGTAGNNCELYTPDFSEGAATNSVNSKGQIIAQGQAQEAVIPQIDYSCNWNKLTFGSSVTDRVTIPLYYQFGENIDDIKNPFFNDPANLEKATKFVVRIRTPCLPCKKENEQEVPGKTRTCAPGQDETICPDDKRYELNDEKNDIVVQWQISGICVDADGNEEECGLVQNVDDDVALSSAITEKLINNGDGWFLNKEVLYQESPALDTNTEKNIPLPITDTLKIMKKTVLTLFLGEKLISIANENVPYLEYQVLTDQPVANSSTVAEVTINVEGIVFKKTLYKEEQKPLIDFAVQN